MTVLIYTSKSSYTGVKVGGAETSLRLLAETVAEQGHSVIYATTSHRAVWRRAEQEIAGVRVLFLPSFRNALARRLPLWLSRRLDRLAGRLSGIERAVNLQGVDIALIYYQLDVGRYVLSRRSRYGYSVVMRMAGLDWYEEARRNRAKAKRYEELFDGVDAINYNSEGLKRLCAERAGELGIALRPRAEFVLDIGVATSVGNRRWGGGSAGESDEAPRRGGTDGNCDGASVRRGAHGTPFQAVVATRFSSYQKRQDLLLDAVALLHDRCVVDAGSFELVLAGEGVRRAQMQSRARSLGIDDLCCFQPFLEQESLWELLEGCDLLCHPCEYEGLSKIIAESMCMGVPVLASDVVPVCDEIEHERTGFLVENTAEAWARALERLIEDPARRAGVSEAARRYAAERYDPKRNARGYIAEFERLISAQ